MNLFEGIDLGDDPPNRGYDEPFEDYENLDDQKLKEQIRQLKIKNEKELRNLFEKSLMISILGEVGQSIQNNFVDQAKRRSNMWANELGIPEKERDIERLISDLVEDGIMGVQMDIQRLSDDGVFE